MRFACWLCGNHCRNHGQRDCWHFWWVFIFIQNACQTQSVHIVFFLVFFWWQWNCPSASDCSHFTIIVTLKNQIWKPYMTVKDSADFGGLAKDVTGKVGVLWISFSLWPGSTRELFRMKSFEGLWPKLCAAWFSGSVPTGIPMLVGKIEHQWNTAWYHTLVVRRMFVFNCINLVDLGFDYMQVDREFRKSHIAAFYHHSIVASFRYASGSVLWLDATTKLASQSMLSHVATSFVVNPYRVNLTLSGLLQTTKYQQKSEFVCSRNIWIPAANATNPTSWPTTMSAPWSRIPNFQPDWRKIQHVSCRQNVLNRWE